MRYHFWTKMLPALVAAASTILVASGFAPRQALAAQAQAPRIVSREAFLADPLATMQGDWEVPIQSARQVPLGRFRVSNGQLIVTEISQSADPYETRNLRAVGGVQVEFQERRDVSESEGRVYVRFWARDWFARDQVFSERVNCSVTLNESYDLAPRGSVEISCGSVSLVRPEHNAKRRQGFSPGFTFRDWNY